MTMIIGFAGKAGAGKDTCGYLVCEYLNKQKPGLKIFKTAFADALKGYCEIKYNMDNSWFNKKDNKEIVHPYWGVTPRQILQFEGTEATRSIVGNLLPNVGEDFWVRRLELEINEYAFDYAIICDVRFHNEAHWVLKERNGLLINLIRPEEQSIKGITNHASEQGFIVEKGAKGYHVILNDSSLLNLKKAIFTLLDKELK